MFSWEVEEIGGAKKHRACREWLRVGDEDEDEDDQVEYCDACVVRGA